MTRESFVIRTGAKINICLEILGVRGDGLHELRSLFAPVASPSDTLHLSPLPGSGGLALSCSMPELEGGENILYAAYEAFAAASGERPGLEVHLEKGVPPGSGLGGASADAAALLLYLNDRLPGGSRLDSPTLLSVAASIGSDVPFFLLGQTAWVTGAGEEVTVAGADPRLDGLVIVCPDIVVSTAWAYREFDRWAGSREGPGKSLTRSSKAFKDSFCSSGQLWRNDFEPVVFRSHPELRSLKYTLYRIGARAVALNGSGSSMTALFGSKEALKRCQSFLEQNSISHFFAASNSDWGVAKW
ncbi:MAG: 4-(cytidine 5'-diphospho)-2-C-methyl-D-erythritol kinase [Desulfohalobiaceae bacterium]|nr:4-(cytidine 5'-diphospho)-2-C-methyl-D-erythritol kinase [Desulfohalobiaceae bacterium]